MVHYALLMFKCVILVTIFFYFSLLWVSLFYDMWLSLIGVICFHTFGNHLLLAQHTHTCRWLLFIHFLTLQLHGVTGMWDYFYTHFKSLIFGQRSTEHGTSFWVHSHREHERIDLYWSITALHSDFHHGGLMCKLCMMMT